jgi:hypothetical protein
LVSADRSRCLGLNNIKVLALGFPLPFGFQGLSDHGALRPRARSQDEQGMQQSKQHFFHDCHERNLTALTAMTCMVKRRVHDQSIAITWK